MKAVPSAPKRGVEAAWSALVGELERWPDTGCSATLWWRDDDAVAVTEALERLLELRRGAGLPLALAVIPAAYRQCLVERIGGEAGVTVLQHGWAHRDYAGPSEKSIELGDHRPRGEVLAEIGRGRQRLEGAFRGRFVPVLVPPWNRIAPGLVSRLPRVGLRGMSTFSPRPAACPCPGLRQTNCHVDLINWRGGRVGRNPADLLDDIREHLCARRRGCVSRGEPTGLLTHHLDHDRRCWAFLERYLPRLARHRAVRFVDPRRALLAA